MDTPRIALIVDHPQRDLAGLLLTAGSLCERGAICYLTPLNLAPPELWALAPDFVLLNYARMNNFELCQQLSEAGVQLGLLDTEGGVWRSFDDYLSMAWTDRELLNRLLPACAWGSWAATQFAETGLFRPDQIVQTGCPRFDFYHPHWSRMRFPNAAAEEHRPAQARVLINTNFSMGNPRFSTAADHLRWYQEKYGWSDAEVRRIQQSDDRAVAEMRTLIRRLAEAFPRIHFIVRPHPHENEQPYQDHLKELSNISFSLSGEVVPLIRSAKAVIQCSCTTGLEAAAAGIPSLQPSWVPSAYPMAAVEAVSTICGSQADLNDVLGEILAGRFRPAKGLGERITEVVSARFGPTDGKAHERVSKAVMETVKSGRVNRRACRQRMYGLQDCHQSAPRRLRRSVLYSLGLSPQLSLRTLRTPKQSSWERTDKYFGADQAAVLLEGIGQAALQRSSGWPELSVARAESGKDYLSTYRGHSLRIRLA